MGKNIHFTNNTKKILHVGNKTLYPGDTREVDIDHLSPDLRPDLPTEPEKETSSDPLLELLDKSIPAIAEAIAERDADGNPVISDEDLARLEAAEESGNTRKGLMTAIADEKLSRANEATDPMTDEEMAAFAETLQGMSEDELTEQLEVYADNEVMLGVVNAEIERRSQ